MDAKLFYKIRPNTELFIVGQNLFSQQHREFSPDNTIPTIPTVIPQGIYGGVTWRF